MTWARVITLWAVLVIASFLTAGGNSQVVAQDYAKQVYLFVFFDGELPGANANALEIKKLLEDSIEVFNKQKEHSGPMKVDQSSYIKELTLNTKSSDLFKFFDDQKGKKLDSETTIILYYMGHGEVRKNPGKDAAERPYEHYLTPSGYYEEGNVIKRSDLVAWLDTKAHRLVVLISDCCASPFPAVREVGGHLGVGQGLLEELFLKPKGFIDINSSKIEFDPNTREVKGQAAWFESKRGGVFTDAFLTVYNDEQVRRDLNGASGKLAGWPKAMPVIVRKTEDNFLNFQSIMKKNKDKLIKRDPRLIEQFKMLEDQKTQTPMSFRPLK